MLNNKKLIPVAAVPLIALILLVAAMTSTGAATQQGVHVPPGAIVDSPNSRMVDDQAPRPVPAAPDLPSTGQQGAVTDTFNSGEALSTWQGISDASVNWVAQDGRLQENLPIEQGPSDDQAMFVTKDSTFADGSIEAEFYPTAGSPLGIVVRGSDGGYYSVVLNMNVTTNTASKAWIERVTPSGTVQIATAPFASYHGYNLEQWQDVLVTTQGNTITVSVDGHQIMSATDTSSSALTSGWAGVWTLADLGASFDNIRIQRTAGR